ncbi:MAG: hypothetical protein IPP31_12635 [Chitinophagaceae bacterium]|nr:hypothetical protein [Chitinophagaceae bacterium]
MSFKSKLEKLLSSCVSVKAIGSPYYPLVKEGYLDFELFMNKGFKHHGLDLKRLSYLEKIHLQAFTDFDNIQPLSILQKNVQDLFPHLPSQGGRGKHISSAGHTILLSNHTDLMLHKNLHIGSGRTQHEYITFLRYGANVHLAAGAFSDIDSLISVMLPPGIKLDGKLELLFEVEDILAKGGSFITAITFSLNHSITCGHFPIRIV